MALTIRAIELEVETEAGTYGAKIAIEAGLTVISAENTRGKSTLVQSVIFALGLEKMLSPRREVPLPRVMTLELREKKKGPYIGVLSSLVRLELQAEDGEIITAERTAKGDRDKRLVRVYSGPVLTSIEPKRRFRRQDYYVLDPGAAQSSTGFHRFLAEFLGWDLPKIPRHQGSESPLYLEAIFALAFVEQKAGWSVLPANFPTYMGLKDMPRRAVEYVLGLRAYEIEVARDRVSSWLRSIRQQWIALSEEVHRVAESVEGHVEGLPSEPDLAWGGFDEVGLLLPLGEEWTDVDTHLDSLHIELAEARSRGVPRASEQADEVEVELQAVTEEIGRLQSLRHELIGGLNLERGQLRATERKLSSIEEDLSRHKDIEKILALGGERGSILKPDRCPTCQQEIDDSLLLPGTIEHPMGIEDNRDFLLKQKYLFQTLQARGKALLEKKRLEVSRLNETLSRLRSRTRALEETLSSAGETPSIAAIERRVELEGRIESLKRIKQAVQKVLGALEKVYEEYRRAKLEQKQLPKSGLPAEDRRRLVLLRESIVEQLREYDFSTFGPDEIQVSEEHYRPIREGFEIGFELSASDAIRLKWAYQLALLEVSATLEGTHHPGILFLDEPRQQETAPVSFHKLIARASRISPKLQVIFTTSEEKATLREAVAGLSLNLVDVSGYLLQPR